MCDGFVTNLALWEKGFTLLPEESVILLDGTPLSWSGRVLITTLVPLMSAATQSGIGRSKASAFSGSGFFCLEKDRLEIFLGCTCGLLFSTWGLLFLFTGLCAGRSKAFAFPENGLTFWLIEPVMLLDSSSLWGGGQFFFISAWTKLPPRTRVCWHFASRQSWVKGKERKWSVKFYLNHFFRLVKRKKNFNRLAFFLFREYCWHVFTKISFCLIIVKSLTSSLHLLRRVLCRGTEAEKYLDNAKRLTISLLITLQAAFAQM